MLSIFRNTTRKLLLKYATPEVIVLLKAAFAQYKSKNGQPFPHKNIYLTGSVPSGKILVLSPHPDDEAIGMGGALSMHLENQDPLTVLYMTNGRGAGASNGDLIGIRRKEAESVAEEYNIKQIFWDFEDTCLTNDNATISAMVKVLDKFNPTVVYVPSFFDHHFDHFSANKILVDALKKTSMKLTVMGYEVWDNMPFPNYILNISDNFEKKTAILSHYTTPLKATDFIKLCQYRDALHYFLYVDSARKEIDGYAEAFYRLDSETYQTLYNEYLVALEENRSSLPANVVEHLEMQ